VLRDYVKDESVDLIYIDPPFNSKRNYNIFFDDKEIHTQRVAFEDTWSYKNVSESLLELQTVKNEKLHLLLKAYQEVAPQVFPYLVMMTLRILELHRVLKSTGSFYLHCDPTASHYLKTICDAIFGNRQFKNEIIWKRTFNSGSSKAIAKKFPANLDTLLFYTKSINYTFNKPTRDYSVGALKRYDKIDEQGRRFKWNPLKTVSQEKLAELLATGEAMITTTSKYPVYKHYFDENKGVAVDTLWDELPQMGTHSAERLGYPTQKPRALLERIIQASSNEGDLILDGFCGCGTTVDAAESLKRQWVGMDISPIAIALMKRRLQDSYKTELSKFTVRGIPEDKISAEKLWEQNPFAFQDWWITEFDVFSTTFGTKGADKGIDGLGMYLVPGVEQPIKAAFQVKGGKVQSKDIDALWGSMNKHKCELGVFLSLHSPTKPMLETVANSGYYSAAGFNYPRLQILTLDEFFSGKSLNLPKTNITFKSAQTTGKAIDQQGLF
jgi:site-specific DNA-methyltransferase (adenine-specific)